MDPSDTTCYTINRSTVSCSIHCHCWAPAQRCPARGGFSLAEKAQLRCHFLIHAQEFQQLEYMPSHASSWKQLITMDIAESRLKRALLLKGLTQRFSWASHLCHEDTFWQRNEPTNRQTCGGGMEMLYPKRWNGKMVLHCPAAASNAATTSSGAGESTRNRVVSDITKYYS